MLLPLSNSRKEKTMKIENLRPTQILKVVICTFLVFLPTTWVFSQTPSAVKLPPMPPHSGVEPPGAQRTESLVTSTAAAPKNFLTHFEQSNYEETGRYSETLEFVRKLEKASPLAHLVTLGKTPQGRDLVMLVVSKDRAFTPEAAAKTGKPIILIQSGIHAGEIGGKDASNMLLRDILVTKKYVGWLDQIILLVIPVFNVDGHERFSPYNRINQNGPKEMGFRVTAQRYNLNRDYVKADAPEMRAWLKMWSAWLPDFLMDHHVTDGMDHQYDVTIDMPAGPESWPTVAKWTEEAFLPALTSGIEKDGHLIARYADPLDERDLSRGLEGGPSTPRFSTGYAAIQNRPALLVETHSLKRYRTQVWAHYDIMRHTLDIISKNPKALKSTVLEADQALIQLGKTYQPANKLFLAGALSQESIPVVLKGVTMRLEKSDLSGDVYPVFGNQPVDIQTRFFNKIQTTSAVSLPLAYVIPPQWTRIIDLLEAHGVKTERISQGVTAEFESYRFTNTKWAERPYEGHHPMTFTASLVHETRTLPAGSVLVPMNQRAARVAFNILEPDGPDSAVRWGMFDTIFEQKEYYSSYVMEPIAQEMLKRDPKLRQEFEEKFRTDPQFAANPRERLNFFYRRSPYYEQDKDVYPVVRVIQPLQ